MKLRLIQIYLVIAETHFLIIWKSPYCFQKLCGFTSWHKDFTFASLFQILSWHFLFTSTNFSFLRSHLSMWNFCVARAATENCPWHAATPDRVIAVSSLKGQISSTVYQSECVCVYKFAMRKNCALHSSIFGCGKFCYSKPAITWSVTLR